MRKYEGELVLLESWLIEQSRECCNGLGVWMQWFGLVEKMEEKLLVKNTTRSDLRGVRLRRRP